LTVLVGLLDVVVQTDLADGAEFFRAMQAHQPVFQLLQMLVSMFLQEHRMQTEGGMDSRLVLGQLPDPVPVPPAHAEHDDALHTGGCTALQYAVAVVIEILEIEVGMGVDQLHLSHGKTLMNRKASISDRRTA